MSKENRPTRRIVILIGLALAIGVPLLPFKKILAGFPSLDPHFAGEVFVWALTALVLLYILIVERRPVSSIGLRRPDWKTLAFGIGGGGVLLAGVGAFIAILLPLLHMQRNAGALQQMMALPYWSRVLIVTRAAVCEEILFRGYGIERLQELTGSRFVAGAVTLAAFTFAHLSYWGWTQVIIAGSAGFVLTVLYLWRRDLMSNMIAHFVTDGVGILLQ